MDLLSDGISFVFDVVSFELAVYRGGCLVKKVPFNATIVTLESLVRRLFEEKSVKICYKDEEDDTIYVQHAFEVDEMIKVAVLMKEKFKLSILQDNEGDFEKLNSIISESISNTQGKALDKTNGDNDDNGEDTYRESDIKDKEKSFTIIEEYKDEEESNEFNCYHCKKSIGSSYYLCGSCQMVTHICPSCEFKHPCCHILLKFRMPLIHSSSLSPSILHHIQPSIFDRKEVKPSKYREKEEEEVEKSEDGFEGEEKDDFVMIGLPDCFNVDLPASRKCSVKYVLRNNQLEEIIKPKRCDSNEYKVINGGMTVLKELAEEKERTMEEIKREVGQKRKEEDKKEKEKEEKKGELKEVMKGEKQDCIGKEMTLQGVKEAWKQKKKMEEEKKKQEGRNKEKVDNIQVEKKEEEDKKDDCLQRVTSATGSSTSGGLLDDIFTQPTADVRDMYNLGRDATHLVSFACHTATRLVKKAVDKMRVVQSGSNNLKVSSNNDSASTDQIAILNGNLREENGVMARLVEMGFADRALNKVLMQCYHNDIDRIIEHISEIGYLHKNHLTLPVD